MDLEAIIVIGLLCLILGLVLLVPGLWWARHKAKKNPSLGKKVNFTRSGWIFLLVMFFVLLGGLSMQHLAPETSIGKLTSNYLGRLIWTCSIVVLFLVIQKILETFGIFISNKNIEKDV